MPVSCIEKQGNKLEIDLFIQKHYCDYCDVFLTHDSTSVRKAHNSGRNHLSNVRDYYASLGHDKAQNIIDQITSAYESGGPPPGGFGFGPQHLGGPPPGFGGPPIGYGQQPMPPPGFGAPRPPFPPGQGFPPMMPPGGPPFPPGGMPPGMNGPPGGFGGTSSILNRKNQLMQIELGPPPFPPSGGPPGGMGAPPFPPNGQAGNFPPSGGNFNGPPGSQNSPPSNGNAAPVAPSIHPDRLRMLNSGGR
ncbi:hypothetical protein CVT25_011138 [Psilocybe cyanescens]|uniref:U1 small nuclear ribonucleoprotein C n=1 Tax=Psilocybe cyanescens TaxID=93625 RepID=A0A409WGS2_PSICY|nr:hypothetical protein CVT25_011138 [Psilocybe cyanescens]